MNRIILSSVVLGALLLAGCSQKTPEVQDSSVATTQNVVDVFVEPATNGANLQTIAQEIESSVENIYFEFNKYNVQADQQGVLASNASILGSQKASPFNIKLEGNCDDRGTDEYNYALGLKRAKSVKDALVRKGIDENRISLVSYGESNPVCTEQTKSCWAKNRRVVTKIIAK